MIRIRAVLLTLLAGAAVTLGAACFSLSGLSGGAGGPEGGTGSADGGNGTGADGASPVGDGAPSDAGCAIPATSDLMLWLHAGDVDAGAGAAVSRWPDRSGHARDFTQTNAANMPTYAESARNGAAAVGFGASAHLDLDPTSSAAFKLVPGADFSIAIVAFANQGVADYQQIFGNEDPTSGTRQGFAMGYDPADSGTPYFGIHGSCCPAAEYDHDVTGAWHQLFAVRRGAAVSLYVDGQKGTDQPSGGSDAIEQASNLWLGKAPTVGYLPFQGSVAEVLVWSRALSDAELTCLLAGLRSEYALP